MDHLEDKALALGLDRRQFLVRAGLLGLTATAVPAFLAACEQVDAIAATPTPGAAGEAFPTPTPFVPSAVTPTPTVSSPSKPAHSATTRPAPTPSPTAASSVPTSSVPQPTATPTPRPTATPTPRPTATPPPTPTPVPKPTTLVSEPARVRHLLWRAGFGASKPDLDRFRSAGLKETINYLVDFKGADETVLEGRLAAQTFDLKKLNHLQRWWLQRMAYTDKPLQEKMTLFWHGILTSSWRKSGKELQMQVQNDLFREQGMGRYDRLLKAISRDAAMMSYLDSRSNKKKAPNENYSRELMELFTMGVDNYTEEDVRESARAFTGWELKNKVKFVFNKRQHDFEYKTFLGRTGKFNGDDVVDIIMQQPVSAEYICTRLWTFFAYDDPEPALVQRLAGIFKDNKTEIRPVLRAMFESEEFYSERAVAALVKGPAELTAGTIRVLGVDTNFGPLDSRVERMGQILMEPPNVAGWDGGASWINSSTLLERLNMANAVAGSRKAKIGFKPAKLVEEQGLTGSEEIVDFFADIILAGRIDDFERQVLTAFFEALGDGNLKNNKGKTPSFEDKLRNIVYLMLASPNYQVA